MKSFIFLGAMLFITSYCEAQVKTKKVDFSSEYVLSFNGKEGSMLDFNYQSKALMFTSPDSPIPSFATVKLKPITEIAHRYSITINWSLEGRTEKYFLAYDKERGAGKEFFSVLQKELSTQKKSTIVQWDVRILEKHVAKNYVGGYHYSVQITDPEGNFEWGFANNQLQAVFKFSDKDFWYLEDLLMK